MDSNEITEVAQGGLKRKLETATNVAVLIAATLVASYFVLLLIGRFKSTDPPYRAAAGTRLALPEAYDFEAHERTLILVIQDDCTYCEDSMPFYREIALEVGGGCPELGLVAVLPNTPETAETLLRENSVKVPWVANISLDWLGVTGTPTLLLVDRHGTLLDFWVGELSADLEKEVLGSISPGSTCG